MTTVVDPYLISMPIFNIDADTVRRYALQLLKWDSVFRTQRDEYVVSSRAMSVIYTLGLAPNMQHLDALFRKYEIDDLSAYDIAIGCDRLVANYPQMEEKAGANGPFKCLSGTENVIPEEIRERMHPDVATAFVESLIETSYTLQILEDQSGWQMATAPLRTASVEMAVQATVQEDGSHTRVTKVWPLVFEPDQHIGASNTIEDVYEADPYRATEIAWLKVSARVKGLSRIDRSAYRFGFKFLDSLSDIKIKSRPTNDLESIFEAIVCVLANQWPFGSDKHHVLRKVIMNRKNPPQVRRRRDQHDEWQVEKAARVEVTAGAKPLRLHYWRCFDGTYEFANVNDDHHNPKIYP